MGAPAATASLYPPGGFRLPASKALAILSLGL